MAAEMGVPFLGSIPLEPNMLRACEKGMSYRSFLAEQSIPEDKAPAVAPFASMVEKVMMSSPSLQQTYSGEAEADPKSVLMKDEEAKEAMKDEQMAGAQ